MIGIQLRVFLLGRAGPDSNFGKELGTYWTTSAFHISTLPGDLTNLSVERRREGLHSRFLAYDGDNRLLWTKS